MIWVFLTLAFALSAALLVGRWCRPDAILLRLVVVLVLFAFFYLVSVHAAALAETLGLTESFSVYKVAIAAMVILTGLCLASFVRNLGPSGQALAQSHQAIGERFQQISAIARSYQPTSAIVLLCLFCVGSWFVFVANSLISYTAGWDGLTYHMPVALSWLQAQSVAIPGFGGWKFAQPANGEVGIMLLLGAGIDRLGFLFNLIAALVGGLAIYLLSRRLCRSAEAAVPAVAVYALLPMVQFQAVSTYVDLYGACFLLAGIAIFAFRNEFAASFSFSRSYRTAIALTGICWGIAVGTKLVLYTYGALCCAGALVVILRDRDSYGRWPFWPAVILVGCMLLPSGFWLLRALLETGNPFYPVEIRLFDSLILPGYSVDNMTRGNPEQVFVTSALAWFTYPWVEFKNLGYSYGTGSGLGAAWAVFVPAGLVASAVYAVRNLNEGSGRTAALLLMLFVAMVLLWSFGLRRLPRFGLPFVLLACVFSAPVFEYLLATRLKVARLLIVLAFGTTAVLSTFPPLHDLLGRIRANTWSRAAVFEIPAMIDSLPPGTVIWNVGAHENMTFPLAGENLANRVVTWRWSGVDTARKFIEEQKVEYVVDREPFCCAELRSLGARLVFDGIVDPNNAWRVWALPTQE